MNDIFYEEQKNKPWWIFALSLAIIAPLAWGLMQQLYFKIPFGDNPMSDNSLIIFSIIFGLGFPYFILSMKQITKFDGAMITAIFFPIWKRSIKIEQIGKYYARDFSAFREFGGWGIKYDRNKVEGFINFGATSGVQFELKNGKKILIGSQNTDDFLNSLKQYLPNNS